MNDIEKTQTTEYENSHREDDKAEILVWLDGLSDEENWVRFDEWLDSLDDEQFELVGEWLGLYDGAILQILEPL